MTNSRTRRVRGVLAVSCALCGLMLVDSAAAQFHIPGMPGSKKDKNQAQQPPPDPSQMPPMPPGMQQRQQRGDQSQVKPPGVPVPMDSPIMMAFQKLGQQTAYHTRISMVSSDPQMMQMMAQMSMAPMETIVSGDTKQVIMRMKMPAMDIPGQMDDWEFKAVSRNGRAARLISSPAAPRLLKQSDEKFAAQMAQQNQMAARSIAQSLAQGPFGAISAGVEAASTAASDAMAVSMQKQMHDFFKWKCVDAPKSEQPVNRSAPPPLTDLKLVGDNMLDGVPVTTYEFYVLDKGEFHGPIRMHVTKDTGVPARLEMSDPRMHGGMQMDYYDMNKSADIEVPPCLSDAK